MLAKGTLSLTVLIFAIVTIDGVQAGDKRKALKPRLFVDFTRITDSGTPYSEPLAVADFGAIVDFHRDSHLFLVDQADRVAFEKVLRVSHPLRLLASFVIVPVTFPVAESLLEDTFLQYR